jgi:hypothetical protein
MSETKPCPACGVNPVAAGLLMCRGCWGSVPADLQRAVHRTWREFLSACRATPRLRREERNARAEAYRDASDEAIAQAKRMLPT